MKSTKEIAEECYRLFCKSTTNVSPNPWDDMPSLYTDAWIGVVAHVLQDIPDRPKSKTQSYTVDQGPAKWLAVINKEGDIFTEVFTHGETAIVVDGRKARLRSDGLRVYVLED